MSCLFCAHFFDDEERFGSCDAFLDGIPFIINSGSVSHDKPLPNQENDVVFEKIKE